MTFLVERLAELRRHLRHLRELRPRVPDAAALERDLSLHNDVLYSLLTVCQLVIDIAGELSAKQNRRFETYGEAIRNSMPIHDFRPRSFARWSASPAFATFWSTSMWRWTCGASSTPSTTSDLSSSSQM